MARTLLVPKLMPFVIKMTTPSNNVCWVSAAKSFGARTLGPREKAELFPTQAAAHAAIASIPQSIAGTGVIFSIHSAQ